MLRVAVRLNFVQARCWLRTCIGKVGPELGQTFEGGCGSGGVVRLRLVVSCFLKSICCAGAVPHRVRQHGAFNESPRVVIATGGLTLFSTDDLLPVERMPNKYPQERAERDREQFN